MYLDRNGITIKKKLIPNELSYLRNALTITPKENVYCNIESESYPMYVETDKTITIPRFFGTDHHFSKDGKYWNITTKYGEMKNIENRLKDNCEKIDVKFKGELREPQKIIVDKTINHLNTCGGGLLVLPCAAGKTVLAIKLVIELGLKALIIVHKNQLISQWKERIEQFSNMRVGIIQQNKIDVENKDIVVGMIQSISKRNYDELTFNGFGTAVFDECHHVGAQILSKCLMKTGCQYIIGLSATPERKDNATCVLYWYLGNIIQRERPTQNERVNVKLFYFHSIDDKFRTIYRPIKGVKRAMVSTMVNNLCEIKKRTHNIKMIIKSIITSAPMRKILILADRIDLLKEIKHDIDIWLNDNDIKKKWNTYIYIGSVKNDARKIAETQGDIIFATGAMAKEALDIPRLNTLILTTPIKDIVQACGRIMRKIGDIAPLIVDFIDDIVPFGNYVREHLKFYKNSHYRLQTYRIYNGKLMNLKDYHERISNKSKIELDYTPDYNIIFDDASLDNDIYITNYSKTTSNKHETHKRKLPNKCMFGKCGGEK